MIKHKFKVILGVAFIGILAALKAFPGVGISGSSSGGGGITSESDPIASTAKVGVAVFAASNVSHTAAIGDKASTNMVNALSNSIPSQITAATNSLASTNSLNAKAGTNSLLSAFVNDIGSTNSVITDGTNTLSAAQGVALLANPQSMVLGGCGIVWSGSGLTYNCAQGTYKIANIGYTISQSNVTCAAADGSNTRIDRICPTSSGTWTNLTGTPSANPIEPAYDEQTMLPGQLVIIPAGATTPSNAVFISVYDENNDYTATTNSATITTASTSEPNAGTLCINATSSTNTAYARFNKGSTIDLTSVTLLNSFIKSKASWGTKSLVVTFRNSAGTQIGTAVTIDDGFFGFVSTQTTSYQQISIPISNFAIPPGQTVQMIQFTVTGGGATMGFRMDDISLQQGVPFQTLQNTFQTLRGDNSTSVTASGSSDSVTLSGGTWSGNTWSLTTRALLSSYQSTSNAHVITQSDTGKLLILAGGSTNIFPAANSITGVVGVLVRNIAANYSDQTTNITAVTGTSQFSSAAPTNAVNGSIGNGLGDAWITGNGSGFPQSLKVTFSTPKTITRTRHTHAEPAHNQWTAFELYGSNLGNPDVSTDSDWSLIGGYSVPLASGNYQVYTNVYDNPSAYTHYRFKGTAGEGSENVWLVEIRFDSITQNFPGVITLTGSDTFVGGATTLQLANEGAFTALYSDGVSRIQSLNAPVINNAAPGSIPFLDTFGSLTHDNAQLYWNNALNRLGVGTTTPTNKFSVKGIIQSETGGFVFPDASIQTTAFTPTNALAFTSASTNFTMLTWGTWPQQRGRYRFSSVLSPTIGTGAELTLYTVIGGVTNPLQWTVSNLGLNATFYESQVIDFGPGESFMFSNTVGTASITNGFRRLE